MIVARNHRRSIAACPAAPPDASGLWAHGPVALGPAAGEPPWQPKAQLRNQRDECDPGGKDREHWQSRRGDFQHRPAKREADIRRLSPIGGIR